MLVDAKEEIKPDLWVLANGCNEHLKGKIKLFPEAVRLQKEANAKKKAEAEAAEKREAEEKKRKHASRDEQMKDVID